MRGDDGGVEALSVMGLGEKSRVDLEIACDDEGEGARAGVGADGGADGEVFVGESASSDEVNEVEVESGGRAGVDVDGDGAAWDGGASAYGARGPVADKDADSAAGAEAGAREARREATRWPSGSTSRASSSF